MTRRPASRRAGILVPLFSIPSSRSWGIGEIGDIEPAARWLEAAGQRVLQLLPINEMPPGEMSPYSALSAMAIDPQFITIADVEDFHAIGGEPGLGSGTQRELERLKMSPAIDYRGVRALKKGVLRRCFAHFLEREWASGTRRAADLKAYISGQAWWLEDYALYRALKAQHQERAWMDWPEPLRSRDAGALADAREALAGDILYRQYVQWLADDQWGTARERAGDVALFGDLPFMVSGDSADIWGRQDEFRLDASVGVPPDAFSETGQDWGLPVYRWDVLAERDYDWLRNRARRYADLYDGYRVDHLVGFYRTYFRPHGGGEPEFVPAEEAEQTRQGEAVLAVFREPGTEIIAEDLGVVPDFVRESLTRLVVPGYKVFRWERQWEVDDKPFKDPATYPPVSVAASGTHDTEPMAIWWESAPKNEKEAVLAIPSIRAHLSDEAAAAAVDSTTLSHGVREAMLESLYASGSNLLILPVQDVFGWRDRINQPATVRDDNWTWRLPWPADRLTTQPAAMAVARQLAEWSARHAR
ncbi:MAG TPA: 4-alpha-glucanotransferase [Gemmatimonadaceae bacterium]|nr:4-alpha-glucanotransferase [Gemmatimonadaceae bacterium]